MTKLLHVTDLHANRRWFNWTLDHSADFDLIIYTGDFVDAFGPEPLGAQVRWITSWAKLLRRPIIWTSGNHDLEPMVSPAAGGAWLRNLPGAKAFSASGQLECLGHSFARVKWRGVIPQLRKDDIVLSHDGPAGLATARTKGGCDRGNMDLADAISSVEAPPWLVLSGHIHDCERWIDRSRGTVSLNPGVNEGADVPNYIEIDTTTKKARLFKDEELADLAEL